MSEIFCNSYGYNFKVRSVELTCKWRRIPRDDEHPDETGYDETTQNTLAEAVKYAQGFVANRNYSDSANEYKVCHILYIVTLECPDGALEYIEIWWWWPKQMSEDEIFSKCKDDIELI